MTVYSPLGSADPIGNGIVVRLDLVVSVSDGGADFFFGDDLEVFFFYIIASLVVVGVSIAEIVTKPGSNEHELPLALGLDPYIGNAVFDFAVVAVNGDLDANRLFRLFDDVLVFHSDLLIL